MRFEVHKLEFDPNEFVWTHKTFVVHDLKAESYSLPFYAKTRGLAIRMFTQELENPNSQWSRFPLDFQLYETGEYSELSGKHRDYLEPKHLGGAVDFLTTKESE